MSRHLFNKKHSFKNYISDPLIKLTTFGSVFVNAVTWGLLVWKIVPAGGDVILHYSIHLGIDRLGPAWMALHVPALGLIIICINILVGVQTRQTNELVGHIFGFVSLFANILLLIAAFILILANV